MNRLDNFLFFLILDFEMKNFNISGTVSRMISIDKVDTCFIAFTDYSMTSLRLCKTVKDMTNKETDIPFVGDDVGLLGVCLCSPV